MKRLRLIAILLILVVILPFVGKADVSEEKRLDEVKIPVLSETAQALASEHFRIMQETFDSKASYQQMQNAVTVRAVDEISLDRSIVTGVDNSFSHKLDDWPVTNQKRSGRCWMFAGLNLLRTGAMKKMKLEDFEFSQSYVFFWDKVERANYFLEAIIDTAGRADGDRLVDYLLSSSLSDGGQWNMFVSLVKKHGLVPKPVMPESKSTSDTGLMNKLLRSRLHEGAKRLRDMASQGAGAEELRAAKHEILTVIYRMLCIHMGTPPQHFDWQWRDKDKEFHRDGRMTPRDFAEKYVTLDLDEYVCLIHDPRPSSPVGRTFTVAYLGSVVGGEPIMYLNVDIELIKKIAMQTVVEGEPVWFGCDVGQQMSGDLGLWDSRLFNYEGVYDTRFTLNKSDRLIYHRSRMTHAMLFTGVDVVDGRARRWRVENSWGDEIGRKGFFIMNDSWFDEFVFAVVARKSYLPRHLQKALELEPIVLPPWDPFGELLRFEQRL